MESAQCLEKQFEIVQCQISIQSLCKSKFSVIKVKQSPKKHWKWYNSKVEAIQIKQFYI